MSAFKSLPKDLLLIVFIHGFRGGDDTFVDFPARLNHVLSETVKDLIVECVIFPAYETKGELAEAVNRLSDWLIKLTREKETAGNVKVKIALCGHSMGGLVAADTLLKLHPASSIVAIISFDTPYFGLHPNVFKNSANKAGEYADLAKTVATGMFSTLAGWGAKKVVEPAPKDAKRITAPEEQPKPATSGWGAWGLAGAAVAATAAAGAAYYKRDDITWGYTWAQEHLQYVGNLWDEKAMKARVENVMALEGVVFKTFYTFLPPVIPLHNFPRTFIVLPPERSASFTHFVASTNTLASDEVQAHTNMFSPKTNDGYITLSLAAAKALREALLLNHGMIQDTDEDEAQEEKAEDAMEDDIGTKDRSEKREERKNERAARRSERQKSKKV